MQENDELVKKVKRKLIPKNTCDDSIDKQQTQQTPTTVESVNKTFITQLTETSQSTVSVNGENNIRCRSRTTTRYIHFTNKTLNNIQLL